MKASGWGTIISIAAAVGVAMYDFYTSTNDANSALSNYNKSVNDATGDAERLFTTLENTDKTTKVHQETLKELVDKYEEYGIHIDTSKGLLNDEANITQQLIEKKGILIGLIREEASERAKAEQYKKFQEYRNETYDSAQKDITSRLNGAVATIGKNARKKISEGMAQGLSISIIEEVKKSVPKIKNASTKEDEKRIRKEYASLFKDLGAETNPNDRFIRIGNQSYRYTQQNIERLKVLNEVSKKTGIAAKDLGFAFVNSLRDTEDSLISVETKEQDFNKAVGDTSEDLDFNSLKLRYNKMSVEQLGSTIRDFLQNYQENDINFHINVDDAQVPKWMKNLGLSSDSYKSNAAYYAALLKEMQGARKKTGKAQYRRVGKEVMSEERVANRLAQYQKAAENKKSEEDKAAAEKEEKEKEEAKAERKKQAEQRKREAAQRKIEERKRRIKEATDNYKSSIKDAVSDLTAGNEQQNNDLADDGVEKSMRDAELKYDKAVKDADSKIENVAKSLHALNKAKGSVAKSVEQLKKEILASGESSSEYGALIKAYNGALALAGKTLQKSQKEIVEGLRETYDKDNKDRGEKVKKLRADIAALEKLASKATSQAEKEGLNKLHNNAQVQLDWVSQSKDAWNDYYEKYGTFLEKRKALEEKFLYDTQGVDENSPQFLMLKKQHDEAVSALEAEEKMKDFDWMNAFGDLSKLSNDTLEKVKQQLWDIIQLDDKLNATDKAKFVEKYKQASEQIDKNKTSWAGDNFVTKIVGKKLEDEQLRKNYEIKKAEFEKAKQNNYEAEANKITADAKLSKSRQDFNAFLKDSGSNMNADQFSGMDMSQALNMFQQSGGDMSQFGQKFQSLFKGFGQAQGEAANMASSAAQTAEAMQGAQQGMEAAESAMGGSGASGAAMTEAIIKGVNQNVQSLNELTKKWGDEDSNFSKGMNAFAESSNEAVAAFDSLKSGDVFGIILHLSNAIESLGTSMAYFFGFNDGMKAWKDELEHYEKLSGIWSDLIDKKQEYIDLKFGNNAKEEVKEVEALYKAEEKSLTKLAESYLKIRKPNAHSYGYRIDRDLGTKGLQAMSQAAGVQINSVSDLTNLSYDQLVAAKGADNGEYWAKLPVEMQDYLDKLIECKKATQDFQEDMKEKFTGIKFDDMYSNFMSVLEDMNSGADDFANSVKDKMRKALIDNTMGKAVEEWTKDFTERYQKQVEADGGKLTEEHARQFQQELEEASNNFTNQRNDTLNNSGLGGEASDGSQTKGFAAASESSIEELSGRALAQTEALYQIRDIQNVIQSSVKNIEYSIGTVRDIQENSYLELVEIRKNTGVSSKAISGVMNEVSRIRKKIENL